jgi:hypothetical protein
MASQSVILLAEARAHRERAEHARTLSQTVFDDRTTEALLSYAVEPAELASKLEVRADRLAKLSRDLVGEIAKAKETLTTITGNLAKTPPEK